MDIHYNFVLLLQQVQLTYGTVLLLQQVQLTYRTVHECFDAAHIRVVE